MSNRKRNKHRTRGEERKEEALKKILLQELYRDIKRDSALRTGIMELIDESRPAWTAWEDVTDRVSSPLARQLGVENPQALLLDAWGPGYKDVRVYENSRYFVYKRPFELLIGGLARICHQLSIKDQQNTARHDWRDFQRIKNELCGPGCEACEVYPGEDRLVDTSNQFYLWVLPEGERFPFGFEERCVMEEPGLAGSRQRRFEPDARPADLKTVPPGFDIDRLQRLAKEVRVAEDKSKAGKTAKTTQPVKPAPRGTPKGPKVGDKGSKKK